MKVLIIPVKGTPADDYELIYDVLRFSYEHEYAEHFRKFAQCATVDPNNPYVEIKLKTEQSEK